MTRGAAMLLAWALMPAIEIAAQRRVKAQPAERDFVASLDKSWATGDPQQVLAHFDFVHAGLRNALARRIDRTVRRETRKTEIVDAFEIQRADGRAQRAFFLSTEIQPVATPRRELVLFEVLVLRPSEGGKKPRAMLLMPTTKRAQQRVLGKAGRDLAGLPIGSELERACPVCKWGVKTPAKGNWAVLLRDSTYSSCAENVEIYNLDVDLMMGVRVEPDTIPGLNVNLEAYISRCHAMLARLFGVEAKGGAAQRETLAGVTAFRRDLHVAKRSWRLYALRSGPITYLLNLQGPRSLLQSKDMKVGDLLKSFRLIDDGQKPQLQTIQQMHAHGKMRGDGLFVSKSLGISVKAPFADWPHQQPMGNFEMQAYWAKKGKGRFTLFCLGSSQRRIDEGQAKRYLLSWLAREKLSGTFCHLEAGEIERRRLGGIRGGWVEFSCGSRCGTKGARSKAFAAALPHGSRLVLIHGCAEPGDAQDKVYEKLLEAAQSISLR